MSQVNQQFNHNLYLDTNSFQFNYKNSYDFTNKAFKLNKSNNTPQLFGLESGYDLGSAIPHRQNSMQDVGNFVKMVLKKVIKLS